MARNEITLSDATIDKICARLAPMILDGIRTQRRMLMTSKEKAEQLGITEGTLRQWVHQGKINAIKDGDSKQSRLRFEA